MRGLLRIVCATLVSAFCISAAPASPPNPATQPIILILPFSTPSSSAEAWIGKAIQQDLTADLTAGTVGQVIAPSSAVAAADATDAINSARGFGASLVVYGQAQANGTEVRLTGQVLDVATAKPLGALKATGPSNELFHLEDAISGQTLAMLPRTLLSPQAASAMSDRPGSQGQNQQPSTSAPQSAPQTGIADLGSVNQGTYTPPNSVSSGVYSYAAPPDDYPAYVQSAPLYTYSYDYGCPLPAYTYAYPSCDLFPFVGFGGIAFVGGGFGDFDHFHHDHDGDHGHGHGDHAGFGGHGNVGVGNRPSGIAGAGGRTSVGAGPIGGGGFAGHAGMRPAFGGNGFHSPPASVYRSPAVGFHASPRFGGFSSGFRGGVSGGFHSAGGFGGFHSAGGSGGFHGGGGGFHGGGGGRR